MNQLQKDTLTNNSEIIKSRNVDLIDGYQITYEPKEDKFAQIHMEYEYINSHELSELSKLVAEFQSIIDEYPEDVSFAVGNIVLSEDKPIKIRRIIN